MVRGLTQLVDLRIWHLMLVQMEGLPVDHMAAVNDIHDLVVIMLEGRLSR